MPACLYKIQMLLKATALAVALLFLQNHSAQSLQENSFNQTDSFLKKYNKQNPVTHSLLINYKGKTVFERYYNGFTKSKLNNLKSITKSITSLLIGIAIDNDLIENDNEKISDLLPELFTKKVDPQKKDITLKHALTMSAGFQWNNYGGKLRSGWDKSSEPTKYLINKVPLKEEPGKVWNYNSALSHLLSDIIKKHSGGGTRSFAEKYLFEPLGIKNITWQKRADGNEMGNSELMMTPRDLVKIGLLMIQEGEWKGEQIVSEEWIEESTEKYFDGFERIGGYGYQWHTRKFNNYESFMAVGWGGQFIIVIPELELVVVNTSKWNVSKSSYIIFDVIEKYIIPVITNK